MPLKLCWQLGVMAVCKMPGDCLLPNLLPPHHLGGGTRKKWNCTGIHLNVDESKMSQASTQMFRDFREITRATEIVLAVRGHGGFHECWKFFAAQPAPSPHPWWRYSEKVEPKQGFIYTLPDIEKGSDLAFHHGSRRGDFTLSESQDIVSMRSVDWYQDERHYEALLIGGHLREAECSDKNYDSHFNGIHTFDIMPFEEVDANLTADESFFAQVNLTGRGLRRFPPLPPLALPGPYPPPTRAVGALAHEPPLAPREASRSTMNAIMKCSHSAVF